MRSLHSSKKDYLLLLRLYSTPRATLKLWVNHSGGPSIKVPIKGCTDVDDFAQKIKQKLNTNCPVDLFSSLDKEALRPGFEIKELLKTEAAKKNSDKYSGLIKKSR